MKKMASQRKPQFLSEWFQVLLRLVKKLGHAAKRLLFLAKLSKLKELHNFAHWKKEAGLEDHQFWQFGDCLVWYFHDTFNFLPLGHSKMNGS